MSEPFAEDFHGQALDESQFLFAKQQGKCTLKFFCAYVSLIYFVELELHDRSKRCENLCYAY
jgi:hypothetical protein